MTTEEYNRTIAVFMGDCGVSERVAQRLADLADTVYSSSKMKDGRTKWELAVLTVRNAFFIGQENA